MTAPALAGLLALGLSGWAVGARAQEVDWPVYGGDGGGLKYSGLTQVNRKTVGQLVEAWSWATGEAPIAGPRQAIPGQREYPGAFEATPIMVHDTLYVSTPYNRVVALDAATGKEYWSFDPHAYDWGQPPNGTGFVHRGVATWSDGRERRIFLNSRWRLYALDAATGQPIESFGDHGVVDLAAGLVWPVIRLHYTETSPPVVWHDEVMVGNGVGDRLIYRNDVPGDVQAFDVRTGKRVWDFSPIPQGDTAYGADTWEDEAWKYTGHTNVWAPFTVDTARGLVYLPVSTPSNDWYGGARKGNDLFAESVVCLDARTGKRVWHYQVVHHGLWDYDLPAPPNLVTLHVGGRVVDAVVAPGKTGFLYVFDRVTGQPVWPIEERPVPQSDVPGEQTSATQPIPTKPEPFAAQGFTAADVVDFTPELKAAALEAIKPYRTGPLFTPPSLEGTIVRPANIGGAGWGGAAVDPTTGMLYIKATNTTNLFKLSKPAPGSYEADYAVDLTQPLQLRLPNGLPISKPPYGTVTAMDLNTGKKVWQVPVGDMPQVRHNPALRGVTLPPMLGVPGEAGTLVTKGGLVFVAGGASKLYALDTKDGKVLWEGDLGGRGYADPMTYSTQDGRQYVVIASGSGSDAKLMAFALPAH
jgi:glucose dehydrogenase